jgi:hypothetical protein
MENNTNDLIIDAHILAYNEEKILPYTLDYYSRFCNKIYVYDNMSTDSSDSIYTKYPKVVVQKWNSNNQINENNYLVLKNNEYKKSRKNNADWVVVCDCDEFLYHPNLLDKLADYKAKGITVPLVEGHDMVSKVFPEYDGVPLTEKVKIGSEVYEPFNKKIVFNPKIDVTYGIGAHSFSAINAIYSDMPEFKLLHYKLLGKEYIKDIYEKRAERLSKFNKNHGFGAHYFNPPFEYMDKLLTENRQII